MKYLQVLLRKNKDYLIILILSFLLSFPYVVDICSGYLSYSGFDLQEFLLWHYTSLNSLIPYRDIFYPYGLLSFFKYYNFAFTLVIYLIVPFLFTAIYFIFKKVFKDKTSLFFAFSLFYLFILTVAGFQAFARYGLMMVIPLIFSCVFYSKEKIEKLPLIISGVTIGLFFGFIVDQGIYLIISTILLFAVTKFLKLRRNKLLLKDFFTKIISELIFVALGFFMGLIPVFLILQHSGSFHAFFSYFSDVKDIAVVAKTPFFAFIDSPANISTITVLYLGISYNFIKMLFLRRKITLSSIFQISLIFTILILEQKSIIRSIDRQIVFVSLTLLMLVVYELIDAFKNKKLNKKSIYIFLITLTAILYGFSVERPLIKISDFSKNLNLLINNNCFDNNLQFFMARNQSYAKIINLMKQQSDFNGKVFTFPTGDSAFYVILNQNPPYYNSIFEGSSYRNQNSTIKYIEDNKIRYVVLNTSKSSLQDAVPDYTRQSFLFEYILNNYQPFTVIGDHFLLKRNDNNDFFSSKALGQVGDYKKYLLDVYLFKIPYSEGLYKYNFLKNNNKLIVEGDLSATDSFLRDDKLSSNNKIIVLIPNSNSGLQSLSSIKFQTENGNSTIVYYDSCKENEACIFDLARLPLFYKERTITKITVNKEFSGILKIFDLKYSGNLW